MKKESPLHFQVALKKTLSNKRNSNIQCYSSLLSLFLLPSFNPLCTFHYCSFFFLCFNPSHHVVFFNFIFLLLLFFFVLFFLSLHSLHKVSLFRGQGNDLPEGSVAAASACDAMEELGTAVAESWRCTGWWDKETSLCGRKAAFLL